jgi:hypothetical protein
MTAFLAAASVLAADANLGADAAWTAVAGGPAVAIRVVPTRLDEAFGGGEVARQSAISTAVMVAADAIPGRPERGDGLTMAGTDYLVAEIRQDTGGSSFTLMLRKV